MKSSSQLQEPTQKMVTSSQTKKPRSPLSYQKTELEVNALVDASMTKFMAQFMRMSPHVKSHEEHAMECKMLKSLQRSPKHPQSHCNRTLMNKECTKKSDKILSKMDENVKLREFLEAVGITKEQHDDESKVEIVPMCMRWESGQPMLEDFKLSNVTQTQKFHKWYMDQAKAGRNMFGFQYKHNHFLSADGEQWILLDEMYQVLQGDALEAQLICLCEL
jgi:hypothetical protein